MTGTRCAGRGVAYGRAHGIFLKSHQRIRYVGCGIRVAPIEVWVTAQLGQGCLEWPQYVYDYRFRVVV